MPLLFKMDYSPLEKLDRPKYAVIPLEQVKVDPRVQREILPAKLAKMSAEWCWAGVDSAPIVVSHRGGRYYVLDGQHRVEGMLLQHARPGETEHAIGAMVYEGLTPEQEALLFLLKNDQSKVNPAATFLVLVTAGVEEAVAVNKVIEHYGIKVGGGGKDFAAVGSAMRIARWANGLTVLGDAFDVLTQAWPDPQPPNRPLQENILLGVARIMHRYGEEIDKKSFVRMLQNRYPHANATTVILQAAAALGSGNRASVALNVAGVLVANYNNSLHSTRQKIDRWDPEAEGKRKMNDADDNEIVVQSN